MRPLGFSLIEVLVAIAVLGFTVPAVMLLMIQQTEYTGVLRDRTIAGWIAQNKLAELKHNHTQFNDLPERETSTQVDMAERQWTVDLDIDRAQIWIKYTVSVSASSDADQPLVRVETYLHE